MSPTELQELLRSPSETLDTELKGWLDLDLEEHRAKIAKVLLSLYNHGGGRLILGFDDKTRLPVESGRPANVAEAYHGDDIQHIVGDYAAKPFEAKVLIGLRDEKDFPVITVPTDLRSPVAAKRRVSR